MRPLRETYAPISQDTETPDEFLQLCAATPLRSLRETYAPSLYRQTKIKCLILSANPPLAAQKKSAYVSGHVIDENENPLQNVSVVILGKQTGIITNDTGYFRLKVPAEKAFAIIFSYTGHKEEQKNFLLNENEEEYVTIRLERGSTTTLQEVIVTDQRDRTEAGLIRPNPKISDQSSLRYYRCRKPDQNLCRFQQ